MLESFGCLPEPGGLNQQDAERMLTIFSMRAYAAAHRERSQDGPGAELLFEVKAEVSRMLKAGEIG